MDLYGQGSITIGLKCTQGYLHHAKTNFTSNYTSGFNLKGCHPFTNSCPSSNGTHNSIWKQSKMYAPVMDLRKNPREQNLMEGHVK